MSTNSQNKCKSCGMVEKQQQIHERFEQRKRNEEEKYIEHKNTPRCPFDNKTLAFMEDSMVSNSLYLNSFAPIFCDGPLHGGKDEPIDYPVSFCWHCPKGKTRDHGEGYDICIKCCWFLFGDELSGKGGKGKGKGGKSTGGKGN